MADCAAQPMSAMHCIVIFLHGAAPRPLVDKVSAQPPFGMAMVILSCIAVERFGACTGGIADAVAATTIPKSEAAMKTRRKKDFTGEDVRGVRGRCQFS